MVDRDTDVVRNYEVLILLLQQVSANEIEVKHSEKGVYIKFNHDNILKQEMEIERLQKELE
jgi:hypothetical protein